MIVVVKNNIERYNLIIGYYLNKLKLISITGAFYSETFNLKKYFILFFLLPFSVFANENKSLTDEEIKEKIIGKWNMFEIGRQANIVTYYDNGTVNLKTYICDNRAKKALYAGEQITQYKIKDGYIYTGEFIEDGFVNKLKVVDMKNSRLVLIYDMPDYAYDKIELIYSKTTNMDSSPFCKFRIDKPTKIENNKLEYQADLDLIQDIFIENIKKTLPKDLDEYTTLNDVYKNNNELFYKVDIKNISKKAFDDEVFRPFLRILAINKYCNTDKSNQKIYQTMKAAFPKGNTYIYSYEDEKPFVVHVDKSSCE